MRVHFYAGVKDVSNFLDQRKRLFSERVLCTNFYKRIAQGFSITFDQKVLSKSLKSPLVLPKSYHEGQSGS